MRDANVLVGVDAAMDDAIDAAMDDAMDAMIDEAALGVAIYVATAGAIGKTMREWWTRRE